MNIIIEKPNQKKLDILDVYNWSIWSCEKSVFDWEYNDNEVCFLLEGEVEVKTEDGKVFNFAKGDMVSFPKGLKCIWNVKKAVRKHYKFG